MIVRCSQLARPMVCAGFMFLDFEKLDTTSPAAEEGTAAGELLQLQLEGRPIPYRATNGVYFDDDMKFYTKPLAQDIFSRANGQVLCEQRIDWVTRSGVVIKGQYDASYVDHYGRLCIDDLKYGWGIVEVKENWQLIGYAIGEIIRRGQYFREIVFRILQPRPHHEEGPIREWVISYDELLVLKERIETRFLEIANGKADLQTSSKCKYCPAAGEACGAFNRLFYRALEVSTHLIQDKLTEKEIADQIDHIKRAEEVLKIKLDSLMELGTARIRAGKIIPGYVQTNKYGHREWKQGVNADTVKVMTGLDVQETVLMSPAKVEKMGLKKKLLEQLTTTKITGVRLEKKNSTEVGNKIFGTTNPLGGI